MPFSTIHNWIKIAESENEFPFMENDIAVIKVNNKTICIGRQKENLYAFAYKCPHASGIMADGYIDALGNIVCPIHRYKFNLQNGRNTSGEGYYLAHWPVEKREEGIFLAM